MTLRPISRLTGYSAKGLSTWTPASSKSFTLRVTNPARAASMRPVATAGSISAPFAPCLVTGTPQAEGY
jgi:hypothetical protein